MFPAGVQGVDYLLGKVISIIGSIAMVSLGSLNVVAE